MALNETHDPSLRSWVESANRPEGDFPIQNLPFCVFRRADSREPFRGGVGIGAYILDLAFVCAAGLFSDGAGRPAELACKRHLNALMSLGPAHWSALRRDLSRILREGAKDASALNAALVAQDSAEYSLPAAIGDFTDFYTSIFHATTVGRMFRPENPLMPNYRWLPVAYHGRTSSIGVSGQQFVRPRGQLKNPEKPEPEFGLSRRIDYELELGAFMGPGNDIGRPIPIDEADWRVFGFCVLNDWSARDIQSWEYQPLGPFLGKNFATTISPWIVTMEALEPFRTSWSRSASDPQPLPHLDSKSTRERGAFDIELEVLLSSAAMRAAGLPPARLSGSNYRDAYWTMRHMIAHHTSNGCNLRSGDLIGTGTQSGPKPDQVGSILELTKGGKEPVKLPGGETRSFIEDFDTVIMRASCRRDGFVRIGFGDCAGTVLPGLTDGHRV